MPEPTIAEILAEARRLREAVTDALATHPAESALDKIRAHQAFCGQHFSRLAAVCEAAMRCVNDPFDMGEEEAFNTLRSLFSGEKGGANG